MNEFRVRVDGQDTVYCLLGFDESTGLWVLRHDDGHNVHLSPKQLEEHGMLDGVKSTYRAKRHEPIRRERAKKFAEAEAAASEAERQAYEDGRGKKAAIAAYNAEYEARTRYIYDPPPPKDSDFGFGEGVY